jgi:5-methylcytosine-specific restriction endonuclease McrA
MRWNRKSIGFKECPSCNLMVRKNLIRCACGEWDLDGIGGPPDWKLVTEIPFKYIEPKLESLPDRMFYAGNFYSLKIKKHKGILFKKTPHCVICKKKITRCVVLAAKDKAGVIFATEDYTLMTVDHSLPRCKGGESKITNYNSMCADCNKLKRDKTLEEFLHGRSENQGIFC